MKIVNNKEEFVKLRIAKLLREKGFDDPVFARWNIKLKEKGFQYNALGDPKSHNRGQYSKNFVSIPTRSHAVEWVRLTFGYYIYSRCVLSKNSTLSFYSYIIDEQGEMEHALSDTPFPTPADAIEEALHYCLTEILKNDR